MRHAHRQESAIFWLSLSGVLGLIGFGLIAYEGTRIPQNENVWDHPWFRVGVVGIGACVLCLAVGCILFARHWWKGRSATSEEPRSERPDVRRGAEPDWGIDPGFKLPEGPIEVRRIGRGRAIVRPLTDDEARPEDRE